VIGTKENPTWLKVKFSTQKVAKDVIVNRLTGGFCQNSFKYCVLRLNNTKISLWLVNKLVKECGTIVGINTEVREELEQTYTVYCWDTAGDTVMVHQSEGKLNFAEIRIYGGGV
jgi:hypothetical protein